MKAQHASILPYRVASSFTMEADPFASNLALRAAVDRELADVATALKARADLDANQIDAPAPVPADDGSSETADDFSTPGSSREGTPDGSASSSSSSTPSSLSRHSATAAGKPICGDWSQARAALSGNVGRELICLRNFAGAVAALPQRHAAMQQQLLVWLRDSLLPLLRGFADRSLTFTDADVPAVCAVVQRMVNAHAALLMLDPPQPPRSWGEQAAQILIYVYFSDYLSREGVRVDGQLGQDASLFAVSSAGNGAAGAAARTLLELDLTLDAWAGMHGACIPAQSEQRCTELLMCSHVQFSQRTANKQVMWAYQGVRGISHASQQPFQLDLADEALATQDDLVCCCSS